MKMNSTANTFESNVQADSQEFVIGDTAMVIDILRNKLYEHKVRTLVQEYICNARDAHREIEQTKKIHISLPNEKSPVFKVRDFGPGLSPQRITEVFIQFGKSTKRDSDSQTGGYGIGAKSAWAYTDSFTIVSIVDGTKRTYVAHTGAGSNGRLDLMSEVPTQDEPGVEIQIPVEESDMAEFCTAAFRATYFWNESEMPECFGVSDLDRPDRQTGLNVCERVEVLHRADLIKFVKIDYSTKLVLVVDGIPYSGQKFEDVPEVEYFLEHFNDRVVIVKVDTGCVEVSPSRESLTHTVQGEKNLSALIKTLSFETEGFVDAKFYKAKNLTEWLGVYKNMDEYFEIRNKTYDGYSVRGETVYSEDLKNVNVRRFYFGNARRGKVNTDKIVEFDNANISLKTYDRVFFVDAEDTSIIFNKRIRDEVQRSNRGIIIIESKTSDDLVKLSELEDSFEKVLQDFDAKPITSLPYVPTVRKPREPKDETQKIERPEGAVTIHYVRHDGPKRRETMLLDDVDQAHIYVTFEEYDKCERELKSVIEFMSDHDLHLCALPEKTIKLIEQNSMFQHYDTWLANFKASPNVTAGIKFNEAKRFHEMSVMSKCVGVNDPHLAKMIQEYKNVSFYGGDVPEVIRQKVELTLTSFRVADETLDKLIKSKYILLETVNSSSNATELTAYVNAKWTTK